MYHRFFPIAALCMGGAVTAALTAGPVMAQSTIQVEFVAPTAAMVGQFGAANVQGGYAPGYRGIVVGATNLAGFRTLAPTDLVRTFDSLQAGAVLRRMIDTIQSVVGHGKVDIRYLLVDDAQGFAPGATGIFYARRQAGPPVSFVWPFATVDSVGGGRFQGIVRLGAHAIPQFTGGAGGWKEWEEVVVHESHHTQWVNEATKWGSIAISYGGDGGHFEEELLGDQAVPLDEGIATFFGQVVNDPHGFTGRGLPFVADAGYRYRLESWSVLAGSLGNLTIPRIVVSTTPPAPPPTAGGQYALWGYRWRDVPGFYILFSETTGTLFHQFFWRNACTTRDPALAMILKESSAMWLGERDRYLFNGANQLALQLEAMAAAPTGPVATACGTMTSSMLPYAILDILTHFGMTDQEMQGEITRQNSRPASIASSRYLTHRAALRAAVQADLAASPIQVQQAVAKAVTYLRQPSTVLASVP
ncbi:MAG: hypothetical protein ABI679_04315 [Gemmatimonadota bacterium]